MQQLGHATLAAGHGLQHLERTDEAVAGGVLVEHQNVARAFAANAPVALLQGFEHVAVAHLGTHELHLAASQRRFNAQIGHQGASHARHGLALGHPVLGKQVDEFIAIEQTTLPVGHEQAVGIAIKRHAVVRAVLLNCRQQGLGVGRAHVAIDVESIGRTANGDHFGT